MKNHKKHLIITVHGIRTFGQWQERLEAAVKKQGCETIDFVHYKYGYFSTLAFIVPFSRWLVTKIFTRFLINTINQNKWDKIDIISHSFGTHVVGWSLYNIQDLENSPIDTIILSGSVLKSSFPWNELIGRTIKTLVNDCGTKDNILLLSQFLILFTGMAGRVGFVGPMSSNFRNRYFNFGHSDYFSVNTDGKGFMDEYWVPILVNSESPIIIDGRSSSNLSGFMSWLVANIEPFKLVMYLGPFVISIIWIYGLYVEAVDSTIKALRSETELITNIAKEKIELGDYIAARGLLINALPGSTEDKRPYNENIEQLLYESVFDVRHKTISIDSTDMQYYEISSDGRYIYTVNISGYINIWDSNTGVHVKESRIDDYESTLFKFINDSALMHVFDHSVLIDVMTGNLIKEFPMDTTDDVAISENGEYIAGYSQYSNKPIIISDLDAEEDFSLDEWKGKYDDLAISNNGNTVWAINSDNQVCIGIIDNKEMKCGRKTNVSSNLSEAVIAGDGKYFIIKDYYKVEVYKEDDNDIRMVFDDTIRSIFIDRFNHKLFYLEELYGTNLISYDLLSNTKKEYSDFYSVISSGRNFVITAGGGSIDLRNPDDMSLIKTLERGYYDDGDLVVSSDSTKIAVKHANELLIYPLTVGTTEIIKYRGDPNERFVRAALKDSYKGGKVLDITTWMNNYVHKTFHFEKSTVKKNLEYAYEGGSLDAVHFTTINDNTVLVERINHITIVNTLSNETLYTHAKYGNLSINHELGTIAHVFDKGRQFRIVEIKDGSVLYEGKLNVISNQIVMKNEKTVIVLDYENGGVFELLIDGKNQETNYIVPKGIYADILVVNKNLKSYVMLDDNAVMSVWAESDEFTDAKSLPLDRVTASAVFSYIFATEIEVELIFKEDKYTGYTELDSGIEVDFIRAFDTNVLSQRGKYLIGISDDYKVNIYNFSDRTQIEIPRTFSKINALSVSLSGECFIIETIDGAVSFIDIASNKEISIDDVRDLNSLTISDDCSFAAAVINSTQLIIWDIQNKESKYFLNTDVIGHIAFSSDNLKIYEADDVLINEPFVRATILDLVKMKTTHDFNSYNWAPISISDANTFTIKFPKGEVILVSETGGGTVVQNSDPINGKYLIDNWSIYTNDNIVSIFRGQEKKDPFIVEGHLKNIDAVECSENSTFCLTISSDTISVVKFPDISLRPSKNNKLISYFTSLFSTEKLRPTVIAEFNSDKSQFLSAKFISDKEIIILTEDGAMKQYLLMDSYIELIEYANKKYAIH